MPSTLAWRSPAPGLAGLGDDHGPQRLRCGHRSSPPQHGHGPARPPRARRGDRRRPHREGHSERPDHHRPPGRRPAGRRERHGRRPVRCHPRAPPPAAARGCSHAPTASRACTAGCPWISRTTAFDRPNLGDPFVTPVSPRATLRFRTDVPLKVVVNGRRTSITADGSHHDLGAGQRPGRGGQRRARLPDPDARRRGHVDPGLLPAAAAPAPRCSTPPSTPSRSSRRRLGPYPYRSCGSSSPPVATAWRDPASSGSRPAWPRSNLRYLVTHEIAHQWFYGIVGNDQAREPFADEAAADFVARYVLGMRRGVPLHARAPSTGRSTATPPACYYERIYIQGGNLLDDARRGWARRRSGALRGYIADHRWQLVTPGRCSTRSTPRRRWTSRVVAARGSRRCTEEPGLDERDRPHVRLATATTGPPVPRSTRRT